MPEGSHQPESINTGKTVSGPPQAGSPEERRSNTQPGNEPPIAECYPESFSSADLLDTPISVTGLNSVKESTESRDGDPEGTFQQRTVNSRPLSLQGISLSISNRLQAGKTVQFDDYELLEEIGRGGMGVIFRARQISLNRIVALKVILLGQFATRNDIQRFQAEAESAAALRHQGIVPVYAFGEYVGNPFFSMEFIEGPTLSELAASQPIPNRDAAKILESLADAVNYAHLKGVIHRDLKPGNILINDQGNPIITDFGLAKRTDTDPNLTGAGQIIGTPNYMSPEQASGLSHLTDTRSDIYALGAILYTILAGKPPFDSENMVQTLKLVNTTSPAPLTRLNRGIDRDLEIITLKCLEKNPTKRYQNATELKSDLRRYLNNEPILAAPVGIPTRVLLWCNRNPALAVLSSLLAALIMGLAIGGPMLAYHQITLKERANQSLTQQHKLSQELQSSTTALKANLVRIYTERGDAAINASNELAALPSYTAALRGSIDSGEREWGHRFRVGSILNYAAIPVSISSFPSQPTATAISKNRELIACTTRDGDLLIWNTINKKQVFTKSSARRVASTKIQFFANDKKLLHCIGDSVQVLAVGAFDYPLVNIKLGSNILAVAIDDTRQLCVVGTRNKKAIVVDLASGSIIHECKNHENRVRSVDICSKTNRFISACDGGRINLHDLGTGELINSYTQDDSTNYIEFDAQGSRYLCSSNDNTVTIRSAETGNKHGEKIKCASNVRIARFSHSGDRIATGTKKGAVQVWDADTGVELTGPMTHQNSIRALQFNHDDSLLLSSSSDHTTRIWDTKSGQPNCPPLLHRYIVENSFFLPNNGVLTVSGDRMIRYWQMRDKTMLPVSHNPQTSITVLAVSPDGENFATGSSNGLIQITDTRTNRTHPQSIQHGKEVTCIAMNCEKDMMAVVDSGNDTFIYHLKQANQRLAIQTAVAFQESKGHIDEPILSMQFSPDGSKLLVVQDGKAAHVFNTHSGEYLYSIEHSRNIQKAAFSADGKQILSAGRDGTAVLWNSQSGTKLGIAAFHRDYIDNFAISNCNTLIATGSRDHTVQVLNAKTRQRIGPPLEHNGGVISLAFSPDGKSLVTGARDGIARMWQIDDLHHSISMATGPGRVIVKYSPDGKIIFTANDEQIRLWDAADGKSLGTILVANSEIEQFAISSDSKNVIAYTEHGGIKIWELPTADMRPISEIENQVELVTGFRADFREGLKSVPSRELGEMIRKANTNP